jgi:anti-sigma-28 factor FlgM
MLRVSNMDEHREQRLQELRDQIGRGEYVVNVSAIAEAIVERVWGLDVEPRPSPEPPSGASGRSCVQVRGGGVPSDAPPCTQALAA